MPKGIKYWIIVLEKCLGRTGKVLEKYWKCTGILLSRHCGNPVDLTYVINYAKFGVDRSQGWSLVSSQILGFYLYWKSRP
jgi:hypothetical protein